MLKTVYQEAYERRKLLEQANKRYTIRKEKCSDFLYSFPVYPFKKDYEKIQTLPITTRAIPPNTILKLKKQSSIFCRSCN